MPRVSGVILISSIYFPLVVCNNLIRRKGSNGGHEFNADHAIANTSYYIFIFPLQMESAGELHLPNLHFV